MYDERDVLSVSYMYVWMDCTIGNEPSINSAFSTVNELVALVTHDLKAHNRHFDFPFLRLIRINQY